MGLFVIETSAATEPARKLTSSEPDAVSVDAARLDLTGSKEEPRDINSLVVLPAFTGGQPRAHAAAPTPARNNAGAPPLCSSHEIY